MNVLLIDDDRECLESLSAALQLNGIGVTAFHSPAQAVRRYDPDSVDAVITDYHFPKTKGTDVVKKIRKKNNNARVIVISGDREKDIETLSLKAGADAFFQKPIEINKMINTLEELCPFSPTVQV